MELKINARERKNWGGLDSVGRVVGAQCRQRALSELRGLEVLSDSEMRKVNELSVVAQEVSEPWWSEHVRKILRTRTP